MWLGFPVRNNDLRCACLRHLWAVYLHLSHKKKLLDAFGWMGWHVHISYACERNHRIDCNVWYVLHAHIANSSWLFSLPPISTCSLQAGQLEMSRRGQHVRSVWPPCCHNRLTWTFDCHMDECITSFMRCPCTCRPNIRILSIVLVKSGQVHSLAVCMPMWTTPVSTNGRWAYELNCSDWNGINVWNENIEIAFIFSWIHEMIPNWKRWKYSKFLNAQQKHNCNLRTND